MKIKRAVYIIVPYSKEKTAMHLRFAKVSDAQKILDIYARYIDTSVTFEWPLPTIEEFEERIRNVLKMYPYLVAEDNGHILGYAYAHRAQLRAAYRWNSELSIYIDQNHRCRGIGSILYKKLISLCALQGIHTVYGVVTLPNDASCALHQSLGFHKAAHLSNAGYKSGAWHDVLWFEKEILPHDTVPDDIIPFSEIDMKKAEEIIKNL